MRADSSAVGYLFFDTGRLVYLVEVSISSILPDPEFSQTILGRGGAIQRPFSRIEAFGRIV
jgi:hypothetical protein